MKVLYIFHISLQDFTFYMLVSVYVIISFLMLTLFGINKPLIKTSNMSEIYNKKLSSNSFYQRLLLVQKRGKKDVECFKAHQGTPIYNFYSNMQPTLFTNFF